MKSKSNSSEPTSHDDLVNTLWHLGDLSFLLRESQVPLYKRVDKIVDEYTPGTPVPIECWECHRRLGKSYVGLAFLYSGCIKEPGQWCVYGAPTKEQVGDIVIPNLDILLRTCPDDLKPHKQGSRYYVSNPLWPPGSQPSILQLVGVDYKQGDLLRGAWCDRFFLDEVRDVSNPKYLVENIMLYRLAKRPKPIIVMATTTPKSAAHEFLDYFVPKAQRAGRHVKVTVEQNVDWTQKDTDSLSEAIGGGVGSMSWRREAMCDPVSDPTAMVIPEFTDIEQQVMAQHIERPSHYRTVTCLDTGFTDWNAVLFAHIDFKQQILNVEDELILPNYSTGQIADAIFEKEADLWQDDRGSWLGGYRPIRFGDLKSQALEDLQTDHRLAILPATKWDREAGIANLRHGLTTGRVRIHDRCKGLRDQCLHGTWNTQRTEFERSEKLGHLDALAALVYLYKHAPWNSNPFPAVQENLHIWTSVFTPKTRKTTERNQIVKRLMGFSKE